MKLKVRCLVSNTNHGKYGRLERGLIKDISPEYFTPVLFEKIPQKPGDIDINIGDKFITDKQREQLQKKEFAEYNKKYSKRNEVEHKLAIERLQRRIK